MSKNSKVCASANTIPSPYTQLYACGTVETHAAMGAKYRFRITRGDDSFRRSTDDGLLSKTLCVPYVVKRLRFGFVSRPYGTVLCTIRVQYRVIICTKSWWFREQYRVRTAATSRHSLYNNILWWKLKDIFNGVHIIIL